MGVSIYVYYYSILEMFGGKIRIGGSIGRKSVKNFTIGTKRPSIERYASLANVAYESPTERPETLNNFTLNPSLSNERIAVYTSDKDKRVQIGLRGTANLQDVATDITAVIGGKRESNPYFKSAEETVQKVREQFPSYGISVAGHSLGGSVGREIAKKNPDVKVFGFNPGASVQDALTPNPDNFYTIRNRMDIVSALDNPSNVSGTFYSERNPLRAHGIGTFLSK